MDTALEQSIVRSQQIILSPAKASVWNARSMGFVISMLTSCVLVFGLLSHFANRPSVEVPVQVVEVVPEKPLATQEVSPSKLNSTPTMLALRRAAEDNGPLTLLPHLDKARDRSPDPPLR